MSQHRLLANGHPDNHQLTPQNLREQVLKLAGVTMDVQGKLLRRAISTVARKLKATKKVQLGLRTHEVDDNMAQLRAAEALISLTGAEPSKDVNNQAIKVVVDINLPGWAKPDVVIDVTPLDSQVSADEVAGESKACE